MKMELLTAGWLLSVDMVDVVIGLVAHCGDTRLVGDVIEWDDVPVEKDVFVFGDRTFD